ncbi:ER degradation-enhancing alpha-mannosidase-like protein 3 isoform X2 [Sitodiplosis mosellana]|uniref:ER degradation-enhancing alpha-mannosidase-like protein 3 isoform X2 n=1 Tax=Sitodiplosis mosellana TaxID=263140 RepID=UPI0024446FF0|nr:ER degradation-enhancing alpha-mannosidase-like protein 3 isoform X2 [Sitodiplosis mosellana]XP_055308121.1 ER degradation-enhancing alpha-mannosidase-like protein 3 isoform X2 [Sitodiplosis mosellana]XP_055308122.1 ER degradation-enhancing alpha-mannosidase-like protein 3 isoform X2 [Sitodiplosis mosellana]XP_055308124.1 ER degradation-enhancing alpha-mannosidase-like protein 3 isoform X2 [Sitodiplosis mosellana]XP_055308125.1 ER degradation-enhancing alpha-mannosidase-like protein 3 isofor
MRTFCTNVSMTRYILVSTIICSCFTIAQSILPTNNMSNKEKSELKEEALEMFYHAYRSYMDNAYPADELMPLSCQGRYRGVTPSRGDMDDVLGNFSMTLVDTLDTLVIIGDYDEFEHAVKLVIDNVKFDHDIIVSVFETNIRMVGGLLSAHVLSEYIRKNEQGEDAHMKWYRGQLLEMAKELGYRLLPAFNTTTGIPHARINLKHGMKSDELKNSRETCTACAGTMLLEFAALSRLSGEPVFETKAHAAMDALWKIRHRGSDLMGTVMNVHSGDWVRRDSGVGAGIDSYYEYCLKSYVLLGDGRYLDRFNKHYAAVMKYISHPPLLMDVHMHRPHTKSRNYMDSLLAFWPGLQVLFGDLKPAVQTHEMLYQVMQMHTFLPEAFTFDFQIHWAQHHLRPEFIESTYFLYKATGDHYYLQVAKKVLKTLQEHARVACGFAAVNDIRTGKNEDRMDSFVMSETLKYLYLIFAEPSEIDLDLDTFIFTTEAHLLPLSLGQLGNITRTSGESDENGEQVLTMNYQKSCPSPKHLFPETVRKPLKDLVSGVCPRTPSTKRISAMEFRASNADHRRSVSDMGITMISVGDGKVQLMHSFYNAKTPEDAEKGLLFMKEIVELSKSQVATSIAELQAVFFKKESGGIELLMAGPSHFSKELTGNESIQRKVVLAEPFRLCSPLKTRIETVKDRILVVERGDCTFIDKARKSQEAGAAAIIVVDNIPGSNADQPMFAMSGDGVDDVKIPSVFLYSREKHVLMKAISNNPDLEVSIMQMTGLKKRLEATLSTDETNTDDKS